MIRAFVDGSEGTTGLRIAQRLSARTDVTLTVLEGEARKDLQARLSMIRQADVTFLCLPDGAAREIAALAPPEKCLIDASTAHRTAAGWAYGFPELSPAHRAAIARGNRIAAPGCHASGLIALVYPLVAAGLLDAGTPLACYSLTGYSGGGKKMIAQYEAAGRPLALDAPRPYALGQAHKHLPEMQAVCGLAQPPVFSPIVGDFYNGMLVSVPLHARWLQKEATAASLRALYAAHYANSPLVSVAPPPEDGFLSANALAGCDDLRITVSGTDERLQLCALYDNLGKGASGAAIECMNIHFGLPENAGLTISTEGWA